MFKYKAALIPFITVVFLLSIVFLAGDGGYRYPCQDPENWDSPQCNAPLCESDQTCTKYLVDTSSAYPTNDAPEEQPEGGMTCVARIEKLCTGDECLEIKINDCQTGE